jgi:hypothetical protein
VSCKCCAHLPHEERATRDVTFGPLYICQSAYFLTSLLISEAQILNVETVVLFSEYSKRKLRREEMDVNVGLQIKHMLRFYIFGNIFTNQLRISIPKRTRDQAKATGAWKDLGAKLQGKSAWPTPGGGGKAVAPSKACVIS